MAPKTRLGQGYDASKCVNSAASDHSLSVLPMDAARRSAQDAFAGRDSDQDADNGVTGGGWTNDADSGKSSLPFGKATRSVDPANRPTSG